MFIACVIPFQLVKSHIEFELRRGKRQSISSVTFQISSVRANKRIYFDEIYL